MGQWCSTSLVLDDALNFDFRALVPVESPDVRIEIRRRRSTASSDGKDLVVVSWAVPGGAATATAADELHDEKTAKLMSPVPDPAAPAVHGVAIHSNWRNRERELSGTEAQAGPSDGSRENAHRINNLLMVLSSYCEVLELQVDSADPASESVLRIQEATSALTSLFNSFRRQLQASSAPA